MLAESVWVDVWQHHQEALLKKQHLAQVESLHVWNHTLILLRSKESGCNITHLLDTAPFRWEANKAS